MPTGAVHVTGTAAGLAASAAVIINAILSHFGYAVGDAVLGAEVTLLTYILGALLHTSAPFPPPPLQGQQP